MNAKEIESFTGECERATRPSLGPTMAALQYSSKQVQLMRICQKAYHHIICPFVYRSVTFGSRNVAMACSQG